MSLSRINLQSLFIEREREHLGSREFPPHLRDINIMFELVAFGNYHELYDPVCHCPDKVFLSLRENAAVHHEEEGGSFSARRYQAEQQGTQFGKRVFGKKDRERIDDNEWGTWIHDLGEDFLPGMGRCDLNNRKIF